MDAVAGARLACAGLTVSFFTRALPKILTSSGAEPSLHMWRAADFSVQSMTYVRRDGAMRVQCRRS